MKLLFDFLPILLFFIAYKLADIYVATGVLIGVTLAQVGWIWLRQHRVEKIPLFTAGLVLVLGGATLILHDPIFVKWKPTVVNGLFAVVFLGSLFIGQKTLLERMMGGQLELPAPIWVKLTLAWAAFFLTMGLANLYVAFNFDENTWVNFKLFGMLGLTLVFVLAQAAYMSRHIKSDDSPSKES
ncbi:MAG: septation protein A [Candidatus Competibacteraceae bacterium]|uniref:Inner membrane-spanning protein YciB n=1 Tax=Candidatus Contendobacter odensis Run_B_J11 TaxID=1400861 RepID=A0A7U7J4Y4_9GAMM|nr:septation protein A [Candidatus Contendobacter odensis]MBK8534217.1 septation protein A [Candidatus Competibacteraceae bacterium]MBK8752009.1 septation protein A [Candidatus Competibacteraceae bacterium]CDH45795.1 putative intracellular septation protein involved in cell division [Candidatus Contendobacter odensis Run_B_J11]